MVDDLDLFAGIEDKSNEAEQPASEAEDAPETQAQDDATPAADTATGEGEALEDADKPAAEPEPDLDAIDEGQLARQDRGLLKAAKSERQKRQDLQKQLQELEAVKAELAEVKQRFPQPKGDSGEDDEGPSFYSDPDAWYEHRRARERVIEAQNQAVATDYKINLALSRRDMRQQFPDYDEAERQFDELIGPNGKNNPALADQVVTHPSPAQFIYDTIKARELNETHGGPAALHKKIAELEAKLSKAVQQPAAAQQDPATNPRSQAGARNVGSMAAATGDIDPFDLDRIAGNDW